MAFDDSINAILKGLLCFTKKRLLDLEQINRSKSTYKNFLKSKPQTTYFSLFLSEYHSVLRVADFYSSTGLHRMFTFIPS